VSQTDHRCETKNGDQQIKYDNTTAAVSLTVFNLALETGPAPPRSPAPGPPPAAPGRPRVLMTRRGTLDDRKDASVAPPSTVVHAVPTEPVDDGYDLPELVDAAAVELDPDVILSSRSSSCFRQGALCSVGTTSAPENNVGLIW